MLSCWTQSSPPAFGGVVINRSNTSPRTVPLTRPDSSGRPAIRIDPVTSVPVCSKVNVIGYGLSSPVVVPVQVPPTLAVGALSAALRASQAAHPVKMTTHKLKESIAVTFIVCPSTDRQARLDTASPLVRADSRSLTASPKLDLGRVS